MPRWTMPVPTLRGSYAGRATAGGTRSSVASDRIVTTGALSSHRALRVFLDARDQLRWIDEAQRDQQPDERNGHVDHRHRVDRLRCANAGGEYSIIKRNDERLRIGTRSEERQLEQRNRAHENEQR